MNIKDVLKYGHADVLRSVQGLKSEDEWTKVGVTPEWSIKDHIGHLAAFEYYMEEAFNGILDPSTPTPYRDKMSKDPEKFNDIEAELWRPKSSKEIMDEMNATHARVMQAVDKIPNETFSKLGTILWYGEGYSLDDLVVYAYYGHIQGHVAEINNFRGRQSFK